MSAALRRHDELMRSAIEASEGYVFKTVGDAFCAAFAWAHDALEAVVAAQWALQTEPWPEHVDLQVRMALHTGQCEERDGDYFGPTVNRAARLEATAHGRQVVLSQATAVLISDDLPAGMELVDLGTHRLKDLGQPEQAFSLWVEGLVTDFPPLRSLDNPALPNNLPAQPSSFIGRDREVTEVRSLLEEGRLVTLTGAGGSGKTRLALQVVAELLDGSGDGVWLVELAPVTDAKQVAATMNGVLGVTSHPGRTELEALVDALEPQRTLIMLDNCEHLIESCAEVADTILRRCPQVHLMTTSREPLGIGGETIYRVPPLSLPHEGDGRAPDESDAVALFLDRARAQGADVSFDKQTSPLLVSICRRLDGMPLAIELAAARLRTMSVTSLHERLDQRFRLLTGGSRTALPRQQTLRATVEWSYSLLNDPEQSLLRRLSMFSEGFDLDAAEAVGALHDVDVFDIAGLLGSLVDKSLVVADPKDSGVRYRLLETIRQFSTEHLVEHDGDEASETAAAHCAHFLSVAEQSGPLLAGPEYGRSLARLVSDEANLRRAIEYAVRVPGNTDRALRFAAALPRYWMTQPQAAEMVAPLVPVLERPDARVNPELLGKANVGLAMILTRMRHETGLLVGERAVKVARELGDDRLLVEALGSLSVAYSFGGEVEKGLSLSKEAVELARTVDDVALGRGLGDYLLAIVARGTFNPGETDVLWAEAIASAQRAGDIQTAAGLSSNAACNALIAGDISAARSYLGQAEAFGGSVDKASRLINFGWVTREEGDRESARVSFEESLLLGRRSGDRSTVAYSCLGLACLAGDAEDWVRSAVLHGVAQGFTDRLGEPWQEPEDRYRESSVESARRYLTDDEFQRCLGYGMASDFDDGIKLALSDWQP
jgi:predicted ATPase